MYLKLVTSVIEWTDLRGYSAAGRLLCVSAIYVVQNTHVHAQTHAGVHTVLLDIVSQHSRRAIKI